VSIFIANQKREYNPFEQLEQLDFWKGAELVDPSNNLFKRGIVLCVAISSQELSKVLNVQLAAFRFSIESFDEVTQTSVGRVNHPMSGYLNAHRFCHFHRHIFVLWNVGILVYFRF